MMNEYNAYDDLINLALDIKDKDWFYKLVKIKNIQSKTKVTKVSPIQAIIAWTNGKNIQGIFGEKIVKAENLDEIIITKNFLEGEYYILD